MNLQSLHPLLTIITPAVLLLHSPLFSQAWAAAVAGAATTGAAAVAGTGVASSWAPTPSTASTAHRTGVVAATEAVTNNLGTGTNQASVAALHKPRPRPLASAEGGLEGLVVPLGPRQQREVVVLGAAVARQLGLRRQALAVGVSEGLGALRGPRPRQLATAGVRSDHDTSVGAIRYLCTTLCSSDHPRAVLM
jgi:hypothetical protein